MAIQPNNLKQITSLIDGETSAFENSLKNIVENQDNFLKEDLSNFLFSDAKRLRPLFVMLFAKALDIKDSLKVQKISLVSELIHSASLVHDDIIDNEKTRRNLSTFYNKSGSKLAVLIGDLLLSLALEELSKTSLEILKIFSDKIKETLNGEINQNFSLNKIDSLDNYFKRIFNKTGNLFLAGLLSLFTLKEVDTGTKDNLINFMNNFSIAFQIKNDISNIKKDNSDFTNGNYTLPVIYFFMENECNFENMFLNKDILDNYIEKANQKMLEFKNKALSCLNSCNLNHKEVLKNLTDYVL